MTPAHVQLDYVGPTTSVAPRRRSIGWTILALPTLAIPFVHFGCDVSPVSTVIRGAGDAWSGSWDMDATIGCVLGAGLCYGALALVWRVAWRWGVRNYTARALGAALGAAGMIAALFLLAAFVRDEFRSAKPIEWVAFGTCAGSLLGGVWLVWVIRRRQRRGEFVLGSILTPFVAIGAFCLIEYFAERQLGWYLTLFSVPASAIELVTMAFARDPQPTEKETAGPIRPAVVVSSSSS